jgi:uncharacterized membrane protein YjgN (DUF898 family)
MPAADAAVPPDRAERCGQTFAGPRHFEFTGTGTEYFRIWVVNLLLTIATFGVYSAWAKVRRLQYFHRNTRVGGAVFDYHGNPKAILKGRILALALLVAYKISYDVSRAAAIGIALLLIGILPWLLARAFRFRMANSSYCGVRFRFHGTAAQAYRMLILFPVVLAVAAVCAWLLLTSFAPFAHNVGRLTVLLIMLLLFLAIGGTVPLAHFFLKRYQHGHAGFGRTPFSFHAPAGRFFGIYGKAAALFILGSIPAGIFGLVTAKAYALLLSTMFGWLFALLYGLVSAYAFYLFVRPYLESRIQNLVWNHTALGAHRFESMVSARRLLWLHASNLMLITLSFGFYKPFATIRLVKYRVEAMALIAADGLDGFTADHVIDLTGALGQETGDLFDIDIAL